MKIKEEQDQFNVLPIQRALAEDSQKAIAVIGEARRELRSWPIHPDRQGVYDKAVFVKSMAYATVCIAANRNERFCESLEQRFVEWGILERIKTEDNLPLFIDSLFEEGESALARYFSESLEKQQMWTQTDLGVRTISWTA